MSRCKQSMKSMLNAANIRGPKFDAAGAHRWYLANRDLLKPVQQQAFADFLDTIMLVERQREWLRREIIIATRSERFAPIVSLLMSVPGIGEIWAAIIAAEIGPFDRFPNADALQFWAGLTADLKESAGRTQSGNITKAGSVTLRWALCQAALTLCQCDAKQEATRQRLIRQLGGVWLRHGLVLQQPNNLSDAQLGRPIGLVLFRRCLSPFSDGRYRAPWKKGDRHLAATEAWRGCPMGVDTKRASSARRTPEARCTLGAPSARLSLGRLRPRRARFRFARQIKPTTELTTHSTKTEKHR